MAKILMITGDFTSFLRVCCNRCHGLIAPGDAPADLSVPIARHPAREILARDIRSIAGTALMNDIAGVVICNPPRGEDLRRRRFANWASYIHEAEAVDPLIRLAVTQHQFKAIPLFTVGNGRTGRVLTLLCRVDKGLLQVVRTGGGGTAASIPPCWLCCQNRNDRLRGFIPAFGLR